MSDLEIFQQRARAWLQAAALRFGRNARRGLTPAQDLALARQYQRAKYDAGFAGINWPIEYGGQGLSNLEKLAFDMEQKSLALPVRYFNITMGMPIPILMRFCEDKAWVKARVLAALKGEEIWCQLFSEPAVGSDLAGLRLRADRDANGWRLNGQKLWTSFAQYADYGIIVTRTDPQVPKHKGLTYFWVDLRSPGVTVRPVKLANASTHVNEVFFDNVAISDHQRIGSVGGGFGVALATLMIERHVATDSGGFGPSLQAFIDLAARCEVNGAPALHDGRIRSAIARNFAIRMALEEIADRAMRLLQAGHEPGPEGSLNKLVSVRTRQRLSELAIDLQGPAGLGYDAASYQDDDWTASWLEAPTGRIAGGADEILLNTIAEKILGLPQDHRPDKGIAFNQIPV